MDSFYHVWFSTKGRKQALDGEVGRDVKQYFTAIARRGRIQLVEVEVIADHTHLLVGVRESQTLPSIMHQLKGASARFIFLKYPELRLDLGHNSFWQKGYGWRRLTRSELPVVRNYIRTQRSRPLRRNA